MLSSPLNAMRIIALLWRRVRFALMIVAVAAVAVPATAHFAIVANIRLVHVEHAAAGLRVYLRLPLSLAVAGWQPPPYTRDTTENGQVVHYLDVDAAERNPNGLGRLIADAHSLVVDGRALAGSVERVRVYHASEQPPFSTLTEAQTALADGFDPRIPVIYVNDAVVDVRLFYPAREPVQRYAFSSVAPSGLAEASQTATVLHDHRPSGRAIYHATGALEPPIVVGRSQIEAAANFVIEGVLHIWKGTDHLLLVLCLIIGATSLRNLLWRVSGFTVGHTVTLMAGFLGFRPSGAWFVPLVETLIAASIIYAGIAAVLRRRDVATLGATVLIGLLHGFGFSFVLNQVLRLDAPDLWTCLLSFNLGVEIGQVAIVALAWPVLRMLDRRGQRASDAIRYVVVVPCILTATIWTGERLLTLFQTAAT